jgi:hypothetical protein
MINEQINMALNELLKMNLGLTDLSSICSFANHSNDKIYRYVYCIGETLSNKKLRNLITTTISHHAIRNDCVVFHQADSIRVEKKIYSR